MSTRRHLRRVGQHHAAQQAADVKAYLAQRALQQAILFKTIPPAAGGDQLLFQRPIVKVDFTRQQDVEVFKGMALLCCRCSSRRVSMETSGSPVQLRREK